MDRMGVRLFLLGMALLAMAGCSSAMDGDVSLPRRQDQQEENVRYEGSSGWSWGTGAGVSSDGTSSERGWRIKGGKLQYEIREHGGHGGR